MAVPLPLDKLCVDLNNSATVDALGKTRNKDLTKTKMCIYYAQGMCGLGDSCHFAHSLSEVREAPNLAKTQLCTRFMNGRCSNDRCTYAHGEAELVKPPNFKKKMCTWYAQGRCRNGVNCGFAHTSAELRPAASDPEPAGGKQGSRFDYEASTDVPSSQSHAESDATTMSTTTMPGEHLFRMMAGRGSAPLQHQVESMGLAIADLQAKLSELENQMPQTQVAGIKQDISQLTEAYGGMETHLRNRQQLPPPTMPPPSSETYPRMSQQPAPSEEARTVQRSAPQHRTRPPPNVSAPSGKSLENRRKGSPPPARRDDGMRKVRSNAQASTTSGRWWQQDSMRWALAVLTFVLMVIVELYLNR